MEQRWKTSLLFKLQERNRNQCERFQGLLLSCTKHFKERMALAKKVEKQEQELTDLRLSTTDNGARELRAKIENLQEQLTEAYKTSSQQNKTVLDATKEAQQEKEKTLVLHKQIKQLEDKVKDLEYQIEQEKATMKKIQDEKEQAEKKVVDIKSLWTKRQQEYQQMNQLYQDQINDIEKLTLRINQLESDKEEMNERLKKLNGEHNITLGERRSSSTFSSSSSSSLNCKLPESVSSTFNTQVSKITSLAFNHKGNHLAMGGDKLIEVWDVREGSDKMISALHGSSKLVTSIDFSANDELLLGASSDNAARVWHVKRGKMEHILSGHSSKVYAAKFTSDSKKAVTGSHDRTLRVFDLVHRSCSRIISCDSMCNDLCLGKDGNMIISGHADHHLRVWDIRGGKCARDLDGIHSKLITSVSLYPDGNSIVTSSRDNTLKIVDLRTFNVIRSFSNDSYVSSCNWNRATISPDGQFLAAGSLDKSIFVWDVASGDTKTVLGSACQENKICSVSWSPKGKGFAVADSSERVLLWN